MASLAQIIGKGFKRRGLASDDSGSKILLEFDCIIRESLELTSEVSQFPLETGALINDHIRTLPERLTLEVVISATPVSLGGAILGTAASAVSSLVASRAKAVRGAAAGAAAGVITSVGLSELSNLALGTNDRVKRAWGVLYRAWKKRNTLTVVTGFQVFTPMAIVGLTNIRTSDNGDDLTFTISFQKLEIVKGTFSAQTQADGSIAHSVSPVQDSGNQPLATPSDSFLDKAQSVISDVQDKIGGFFA